jgi:hypothetical protein
MKNNSKVKAFKSRLNIIRELLEFIYQRKKWWLIPIVIFLLVFGAAIFISQNVAVSTFIYTLF